MEQVFRIAKSDLMMRPIYHFKQPMIKAHILICFMALSICKHIELKTGKSINHVLRSLKSVTDAQIFDALNNKKITLRSEINEDTKQLITQLN